VRKEVIRAAYHISQLSDGIVALWKYVSIADVCPIYQGCRALTFALARLSCYYGRRAQLYWPSRWSLIMFKLSPLIFQIFLLFFPLINFQDLYANRHPHATPVVQFLPG